MTENGLGNIPWGMKQRLGIVQAIMEKPELLILDEPMNSLDEAKCRDPAEKTQRIELGGGVTVLLSSHHKEDIELLCEKGI